MKILKWIFWGLFIILMLIGHGNIIGALYFAFLGTICAIVALCIISSIFLLLKGESIGLPWQRRD